VDSAFSFPASSDIILSNPDAVEEVPEKIVRRRMMDVFEAIRRRRTIRRFQQKQIPGEVLVRLVEAARLAPSAANLQPLEYIIVKDEKMCEEIFQNLRWAGYVEPRRTPRE